MKANAPLAHRPHALWQAVFGLPAGHAATPRLPSPGIAPAPAVTGSEAAATAVSPAERSRLLVVEDDPTMCRMLSTVLADEYEVEMIGDESAAYTSVQRRSIHLVIVDIHPSRTNGLNLIYALRMDARTRHLPVLVLTASEHRRTLLQCLAAGANNFLLKPFGVADLRACVRAELDLADASPRTRA